MITPSDPHLADTHQVLNQPTALLDYDAFAADPALGEALARHGAGWAREELAAFGRLAGSAEMIALGIAANEWPPRLHTHDRYGHRVDLVEFHPAYHRLMRTAIEHGLHASPWSAPRPGAQVARAAKYYLHTQIEAAHGCPITMTFAAIPALRHQPELLARWQARITARDYDPRNVPDREKTGVTLGMAMTEKQGGSDVRSNTTTATALGHDGEGEAYALLGHKWFVSAPMCDAFLTLAQTARGLGCFLMPRWRPDGTRNALQIQQLKRKMGNVANASCELELRGALAWRVGEEGRGVRTILEMVAATRYDCMIGSAAGMRQALVQAVHHCRQRAAFGKRLIEQPLMRNVLADLALESEAALHFSMRVAAALDAPDDTHERLLARIATPIGKYWICKRTPQHAYEAMECIGGTGVMESHLMARLFRESPVNAIWEGSGNVQCLDLLRAIAREPETLEALFAEVGRARGADARLDRHLDVLKTEFIRQEPPEYRARDLADRLALALQAALLLQHAPSAVAEAFCASRLQPAAARNYGCLPSGLDCAAILQRALPV
jgi:putative acyl-CoA dehydrogenase